nr:peroxisomal hydratase-dehydrogenase-epimerase-like [Onthophagus taurus]
MSVEKKVVLVTGGASGIGLGITKALLKNNAKGVVIADINDKTGEELSRQLNEEFGKGKVMFIKTNVADKDQFENAMKKTVETFKHFDILVNNAGIFHDNLYEKEISINLIGVIHGCRLAMDTYLKDYKSSSEGIIINIASVLGLQSSPALPVYTATKHAVIGLSKSLSTQLHYETTKVKIITICPGFTNTPILTLPEEHFFNDRCYKALRAYIDQPSLKLQSVDDVGKALISIITEGENGSIWVVDGDNVASVFIPPIQELKKIKTINTLVKMYVKGKVAMVTGGANGIGLCYVKELLKNSAKGVTIGDLDPKRGEEVVDELSKEYGNNRVIFVKLDVTNKKEVEDGMKKTVEIFKNFDIMINNAGVMNDAIWEKQIDINIKGTVYGCLLAMDEYIPKYKTSSEGVIINISSIFGIEPFGGLPIYTATKHAVIGLSRSLTQPPLDKENIKIITICPGPTTTALLKDLIFKTPNNSLEKYVHAIDHYRKVMKGFQEPSFVAENVIRLMEVAKTGTIWNIEENKVFEVIIPDKEDLLKK